MTESLFFLIEILVGAKYNNKELAAEFCRKFRRNEKEIKMKRTICILLALVMVFALAACGSSAAPATNEPAAENNNEENTTPAQQEEPAAEAEPITLTAWYYADEGAAEGYNLWAAQVKEKYPNITLEFEELPYDSGPDKFTVACATNTAPDFYFDVYSRCAPAIAAGLTLDVTELREQYADEFLGTQVDGVVDGRYHAIVTNTGAAYCMFVNLSLVKEAGLEDMLPEDHLTWSYDEFLAFLRALKEAYPDIYPMELFAGSQSSDMWYYSWLIGNGVQLTNEDLTATAFNTGDNRDKAIQTFDLLKTIVDESLCNPGPATTIDQDGHAFWKAGKAVIAHGAYSNTAGWYRAMQDGTSVEFEYDAYAMPTFEGKSIPKSGCFGSYSFIAFDSKDEAKNEAIRNAIAVYLENPECQTIVTNATGRLSVMTDTVVDYETPEIAATMAIGAAYSASYTDSSFGVLESWWTEFRGTFYPNLQDLYAGKIDSGTLLDKWQVAGDAVIAAAQSD